MDRENGVEEGDFSSWRRKLFLPLDEKNPRDRRGARTMAEKKDAVLGRVCRGLARCRAFACLELLAVLGGREARLLLDELAEEGKA